MKLDLGRIKERSKEKADAFLTPSWESLQEGAERDRAAFQTKRAAPGRGGHASLLQLFNIEMVEFVRETFFDDYVPVEWAHQATHQLVATSWTHRDLLTPDRLYASSVCAVPLAPVLKKTRLSIQRPLPKGLSAYGAQNSLAGKRAVLRELCQATGARLPMKTVAKMNASECDQTYTNLRRAEKLLRRSRGKL